MENLFRGLPAPEETSFRELVKFSENNASKLLIHLPAFTALIAREISFSDAYRISYEFSGKRIYLPKQKTVFEKKLQCSIDSDTYQSILELSSAEPHIEIPSAWGIFNVIRRVSLMDYLEKTKSKSMAQMAFGANRRFIDKLWNEK